ncbi:hypothetical protein SAMN05216518_12720 [Bacteroidales bacterium KHT7]|nr:hypothetical protein SAMN05216518_12720 [Bacteroidales bacterium KHT7]
MEHSFRVHVVAMIPFSAGHSDLRLQSGDTSSRRYVTKDFNTRIGKFPSTKRHYIFSK